MYLYCAYARPANQTTLTPMATALRYVANRLHSLYSVSEMGQVEIAELRKPKYGSEKKAACQCLVSPF